MSAVRICPDLDRECGMQHSWCATCPNRATPPAAPAPTEQQDELPPLPLETACRNLIAYLDKNPPMGDSLWCIRVIRAALTKEKS